LVKGTHWEGQSTGMLQFMTKKEGRGLVGVKNVEYLLPGVFGPPTEEKLGTMNE